MSKVGECSGCFISFTSLSTSAIQCKGCKQSFCDACCSHMSVVPPYGASHLCVPCFVQFSDGGNTTPLPSTVGINVGGTSTLASTTSHHQIPHHSPTYSDRNNTMPIDPYRYQYRRDHDNSTHNHTSPVLNGESLMDSLPRSVSDDSYIHSSYMNNSTIGAPSTPRDNVAINTSEHRTRINANVSPSSSRPLPSSPMPSSLAPMRAPARPTSASASTSISTSTHTPLPIMTASAAVVAPTSEPVLAEAPSPNSSSYSSSYTTGSAHHSYIPRNTLQAIAAINERGEIQQLKETISTMHEERTATLQLVGSLEKELRETMFALSTVQEKLAQQRTENASLQVTLTNTRKKNALLSGVPEAKVLHSVEDIPLLEEVERQLAHNRLKEDAVELQSVMQGLEGKLKAEMEAARGAQRSSRELKGKVKDMKRKLMSCNETRIRSETRYSHLLEEHNSLKKTYAEGLNGRAKLKFKLKKLQLENESLQQRYSNEVKQNESFYSKERGQLAVLSGKVKVLEEEKKETQEENRACVDSLMRELEASRVREIQMTETIAELKLEYDVISSRVTLGMGDGEDTDRHSTQSDGDSDTAKPRESPLEAESREKEARARTRAEEENKEMAGRIAEMEERNASLAKRASDAQKQLDLVSSDLVDAQQSINELTKTAELERKEREEERKEERKTREAEAKRMADKMSAVEGERTQAKELNSDLNKDIDTLLAEVKKLKASEEKSEQEQARLRTTLANCELEIGQLHERIDYSEVENESLLAQMEEQEKERTERASQRSETDHLLSENAQKLQELTDKLEESESEKQTLMVVRKTLQVRLHEMHIELKKAEAVTARDLFDQMLKDVVRFWSANVQKLASRVRRLTAKSLAREKKAIIDAIKELKQQSYREVLAMTAKLGGVQRHLSSEIERNQDAYIQSQTQAQQARYADEYADNSDGRGLEGSFRRSTSSDEEGGQGGHSRKDSENDHERMNGGDGRGGSGHGGEVDAEKNDSEVTHDKCRQRINELEHLLEVARRNHQDLSSEYQEYARLNSEHIAELEQENEGLFNELSSQIQINQLANEHNLHYTKIVDDIGDVVLDSSEPVKIDV